MIKFSFLTILSLLIFQACGQSQPKQTEKGTQFKTGNFKLSDFYSKNPYLQAKVDSIYATLDDTTKVAQLIMPAIGKHGQKEDTIYQFTNEQLIGGVLLLNGTKAQFKTWIDSMEAINASNAHPSFLFSADAEPTLVNRKIRGSSKVKKASEIQSQEEVEEVARIISKDLKSIGINYNFAPVVDMASNSTVGYRGFGKDPKNIIPWSDVFVKETQKNNIIATLKHFPGHGLVSGDTHKSLQVIDGKLEELKYYPPLIDSGVVSIMVGHIAVENNPRLSTNGMPATTSKEIVTGILRNELGFEGLVVTDAMNMGGVARVRNANVLAVQAGCDIILMPLDVRKAHREILSAFQSNTVMEKQIERAVKRVLRSKICLGIVE